MRKTHRMIVWFLLPLGSALVLLLGLFLAFAPASARADGIVGAGKDPALGARSASLSATQGQLLTAPGDVIVTEIMKDPAAVADASGEWFELLNTTGADIDLNGWTLQDDGSDSHVIAHGGPLTITAGSYLVLGNNSDSGTNGGVSVAYSYGGDFGLDNGADEIILLDASLVEIDRVDYDDGLFFPDPTGATLALIYPTLDNNNGATWCTSSTAYGAGDFGTPGAQNDCNPPVVINEIHADPDPSAGDANGDGIVDGTQDEFVELVNVGGADLDLSGWILKDNTVSNRHIFPASTVLAPGCSVVIFGGGVPTGAFGESLVQTASGGGLNLSNAGDTVFLIDLAPTTVVSYTYGTEGGQNVALTRDPDVTGPEPLIQHSAATGSGGALYSPGTKISGSLFSGCPQPVDLGVVKSGPSQAQVGTSVVYTLTVSNAGILTATGVSLADTLPLSTTYVSDSTGVTPTNPSPGVYAWTLGDLGPGMASTLFLTVSLDSGLAFGVALTNTALITSTVGEDNLENNTSQWTLTVTIPSIPPPVAGFASNSPVQLGELSVFTNTTTGTEPLNYQWDFGDGTPVVTDTNPAHMFSLAGDYTVALTATNVGGIDVYTATHSVLPRGVEIYLPIITRDFMPLAAVYLPGPVWISLTKSLVTGQVEAWGLSGRHLWWERWPGLPDPVLLPAGE